MEPHPSYSEKLAEENSKELKQELEDWLTKKEESHLKKIDDLANKLHSDFKIFKEEISKPNENYEELIHDFFKPHKKDIDLLKVETSIIQSDMKKIIGSEESKKEIEKIINDTLERRKVQENEDELKSKEHELTLIKQKSSNVKGFSLSITLERFKSILEKKYGLFFDDEIYEDCWSGIQDGKPLLFIGAPGTGKTALGKKLPSVYSDNISLQYEIARDDWSSYNISGGKWVTSKGKNFVPEFGLFSEAVFQCIERDGKHWLFIDELNQCNIDNTFEDIKDILDIGFNEGNHLPHPYLSSFLKGKLAGIKIPKTFRFICAMNYFDSHLFNSMSSSLMRRFKVIYILPPSIENEKKIVAFHVLNKNNYHSFEKRRIIKLNEVIEESLKLINEIRTIGKRNMCKESEIGAHYTIEFCKYLLRKTSNEMELDGKEMIDSSFFKHFRTPLEKINLRTLEGLKKYLERSAYPTLLKNIESLISKKIYTNRLSLL